jgi:hypothetical protein
MALDTTQIRVAPHGHLYVATTATAAPADVTAAWGVGWKELGYASDDGVSLNPSLDTDTIDVWQSAAPGRYVVKAAGLDVEFTMVQSNADTTGFFFGSTWTVDEDLATMLFSSTPEIDTRSLGIEWGEGAIVNRLIVGLGSVTDRDAIDLKRTDAQAYKVTFSAMDKAGSLATLLSNDPAILGT